MLQILSEVVDRPLIVWHTANKLIKKGINIHFEEKNSVHLHLLINFKMWKVKSILIQIFQTIVQIQF